MVLAADYPFLDILLTMILFFCRVACMWMLILIFSYVFRRDISGWASRLVPLGPRGGCRRVTAQRPPPKRPHPRQAFSTWPFTDSR